LTSLVHGMATARRSEELNSWRNPIDISSMVWEARKQLPELYKQGKSKQGEWDDEVSLADVILEDDPAATLEAIKSAVRSGASPEQLGSAVAYAAFLRMARFHTSNEFADWDTVHNTLTAANALHQALKRAPSVELLRAVFDTAMSIYLDRFLNVPSQRMPTPNGHHLDANAFGSQLLSQMDVQQQVEQSAQTISDYLTGSENAEGVLAALGHAMLREDSGFHMFQIVDAGFKQYEGRKGTEAGRHVLVALSRFLAAHSPTSRSVDQTFQIAQRLNRGDELFREDEE
ncbi:MAG: Rieske (2Fe-2S) protein, partial [Chloroflexi bacterium]|nr:Rieske (2Fe-2S) protein [Chloroflexota bacterium]